MKILANLIRSGMIIENDGRQWAVLKTQIIKPGKGGAFNQIEMRDLKAGTKTNIRLRTQETVKKLQTTEKEFQFLFSDEDSYTFMDPNNFEQIVLENDIIGEDKIYLKDGIMVKVNYIDNSPISISLPSALVFEVVEAEPVVKGQTAASSSKPAILENGLRIMVPPFVEKGTFVQINTTDGSYIKRAE
mgnify:CR=1 FL=1